MQGSRRCRFVQGAALPLMELENERPTPPPTQQVVVRNAEETYEIGQRKRQWIQPKTDQRQCG